MTKRHQEIIKKKKRHEKLKKLTEAYFSARSKKTQELLIEKIRKIAPYLVIKDYLGHQQ